jgi:hypothetical protein
MHAHRQRLDQRAGFAREAFGQAVEQIGRDVHSLGERTVVHQPGKGQFFTDVVQAMGAVIAGAAVLAGIGSNRIANGVAADALAELGDLAAEFVA